MIWAWLRLGNESLCSVQDDQHIVFLAIANTLNEDNLGMSCMQRVAATSSVAHAVRYSLAKIADNSPIRFMRCPILLKWAYTAYLMYVRLLEQLCEYEDTRCRSGVLDKLSGGSALRRFRHQQERFQLCGDVRSELHCCAVRYSIGWQTT